MSWGPIIKGERPLTPEEAELAEERRRERAVWRKARYVFACALAVLGLQQCASVGRSISECPPSSMG